MFQYAVLKFRLIWRYNMIPSQFTPKQIILIRQLKYYFRQHKIRWSHCFSPGNVFYTRFNVSFPSVRIIIEHNFVRVRKLPFTQFEFGFPVNDLDELLIKLQIRMFYLT